MQNYVRIHYRRFYAHDLQKLPSISTPIRQGVGASKKAVIEAGKAGIKVCCHVIGNSKDSMASNSADKSL